MVAVASLVDLVSRFAGESVQETVYIWNSRRRFATPICAQDKVCNIFLLINTPSLTVRRPEVDSPLHLYIFGPQPRSQPFS